jgi:hypothetical protein
VPRNSKDIPLREIEVFEDKVRAIRNASGIFIAGLPITSMINAVSWTLVEKVRFGQAMIQTQQAKAGDSP